MLPIYVAVQQNLRAHNDFVLRLRLLVAKLGRQAQPGTEGIVYGFVAFAVFRDALVEF